MVKNKNNEAIWGSRIKKDRSKLFQKIGSSINVDKKLFKEDIEGSIAHVEMLFRQKIISFKVKNKIVYGLNKIEKEIQKNKFIYDNNIKVNLTEGDWVVFRNQISLDYGIKQKIVGIGRLENNEIMEMIEIYKGDLAGDYVHWINIALNEIIFKDKHDGCYERPEYYLLELYKRGSSYNCMVVRHIDVTKELNYPDGAHGKAAAVFYNLWINKNSLKYSKIMLGTYHGYFSRLSGGNWIEIRHFINPKIINAPKSKFFSEET